MRLSARKDQASSINTSGRAFTFEKRILRRKTLSRSKKQKIKTAVYNWQLWSEYDNMMITTPKVKLRVVLARKKNTRGDRMNKKGLVVISIAVVLLIGLLIFSMIMKSRGIPQNSEDTVGNTAGNLNNGGYFCETEDTIYFANPYDEGTLYSMKSDLTDIRKLNGAAVAFINCGGSYLYYYQKNSSAASSLGFVVHMSGLYRTDLKGEHALCLDKSDCEKVVLIGNRLFYTKAVDGNTSMCLHSISTNKQNEQKLTDYLLNPASVTNGVIYYNGTQYDHYLYAYDTNTDRSRLVAQYDMWFPVLQGSSVYFLDLSKDYSLCRLDLMDNNITVLSDERVDCFNVAGGYVYYQTVGDNPGLYKVGIDGTNNELMSAGIYKNISIAGGYVFYQDFQSDIPMFMAPLGSTNVTTFEDAKAATFRNMK